MDALGKAPPAREDSFASKVGGGASAAMFSERAQSPGRHSPGRRGLAAQGSTRATASSIVERMKPSQGQVLPQPWFSPGGRGAIPPVLQLRDSGARPGS